MARCWSDFKKEKKVLHTDPGSSVCGYGCKLDLDHGGCSVLSTIHACMLSLSQCLVGIIMVVFAW